MYYPYLHITSHGITRKLKLYSNILKHLYNCYIGSCACYSIHRFIYLLFFEIERHDKILNHHKFSYISIKPYNEILYGLFGVYVILLFCLTTRLLHIRIVVVFLSPCINAVTLLLNSLRARFIRTHAFNFFYILYNHLIINYNYFNYILYEKF